MTPVGQESTASWISDSYAAKSASSFTVIFSGTVNTSGQTASQAPQEIHSSSDSSSHTFVIAIIIPFVNCEAWF